MKRRNSFVLDDKHYDFSTPSGASVYEKQSYGLNRADSIEWAISRCEDDREIRDFVFTLRKQLLSRLVGDFPREAALAEMLRDGEDPNHFFVIVGQFAGMDHSAALKQMGLFFCEQLKTELNLDLHPTFFKAERP